MPRATKAAAKNGSRSRQKSPAKRKPAARPRKPAAKRADAGQERIRHLVALDAATLMRRIAAHADEMVGLFSRHRDREPLLTPLRSVLPTMGFHELSLLSARQQSAVSFFVEELEALRWYFRYTTDMPGTAEQRFRQYRRSLDTAYERLVAEVGRPEASEPAPELPQS